MRSLRSAPLCYLYLVLGCWLSLFTLTRLVLIATHWDVAQLSLRPVMDVLAIGWLYDFGFITYAALPLGLYVLLCPPSLWRRTGHQRFLQVVFFLSLYLMLFCAVAEWLFWDEFGVRFNFIAVDYLVYSTEVLHNIQESYPVPALLTAIGVLSLGLSALLQPTLRRALAAPLPKGYQRGAIAAGLFIAAGSTFLMLSQDNPRGHQNHTYQRELASNGPYQFMAAFRNNELDYSAFYATLPENQLASQLREELKEPNARFINQNPLDVRRYIDSSKPFKPHNIVLVTIESLSAKYLGSFGDPRGLTPNLDQLRAQSWFFNRFYATGTRTTRGLEAITLSVPPTPGRSIVKRIGRESGFASLGQQLSARGYDSVFLYGGRGYFDNMNAFFSGNGYRVVDQTKVADEEIHFKNAWGMADEDLYTQAVKIADEDHAQGKPFLLQLMTTSNHRPYTYPDGRIDIPSGEGREGSVKYTDWAIGEFLKTARDKPWFDNTLFVFVADHCAGSAGSQDLPVENYRIPLFIYAPTLIKAREDAQLASQIDLAPTLLGLLHLNYTSQFFGRDLNQRTNLPPRVLIGNYQHLGLFDGKDLAILSPMRGVRLRQDTQEEQPSTTQAPLVQRNVTYYQTASLNYRDRRLDWQPDDQVLKDPAHQMAHKN